MSETNGEMSAFAIYSQGKINKKKNKKKKPHVGDVLSLNLMDLKQNVNSSSQTKLSLNKQKKKELKKILINEEIKEIANPVEVKLLKVKKNKKQKAKKQGQELPDAEPESKCLPISALNDSEKTGVKVFTWLLDPITPDKFFNEIWEKGPLHIKRKIKNYFSEIISTAAIDLMFRTNNMKYTKNVDVTSYVDGKRETLNPEGRVYPAVVWDYYSNGCSIRLLNPQTYCVRIQQLCATLQEYFGSFVGANIYLTPPGTQGFAPHYDDIEAFILQIEGKKHWRIYQPRSSDECLPRYSSPNFTDEDIGEPIFDEVVEPGDLLYFPRGYIHQGNTLPDSHSLHITLSTYQKWTWGDLLEKAIPIAVKKSFDSNVEFREGLPLGYLNYVGYSNRNNNSDERKQFMTNVFKMISQVFDRECVDMAVDQMAKQFQHDALPPVLTTIEKELTVFGDGEKMIEQGEIVNRVELEMDTKVRLLRKNILRIIFEDDVYRLYYYVDNSKEYHSEDQQFLEIDDSTVQGVEYLIHRYPSFTRIETIPIEDEIKRVQVVSDLWENGLIMTKEPLPSV